MLIVVVPVFPLGCKQTCTYIDYYTYEDVLFVCLVPGVVGLDLRLYLYVSHKTTLHEL